MVEALRASGSASDDADRPGGARARAGRRRGAAVEWGEAKGGEKAHAHASDSQALGGRPLAANMVRAQILRAAHRSL